MKRIGLLSDTHSFWDPKYLEYFEECDEIWHAGDIGSMEVVQNYLRSVLSEPYTETATVGTSVKCSEKNSGGVVKMPRC